MHINDDTVITNDEKLEKTGIGLVSAGLISLAGLGLSALFGEPQKAYKKAKQGKWGEAAAPAAWTALNFVPFLGTGAKVAKVPHYLNTMRKSMRAGSLAKGADKARRLGKVSQAAKKSEKYKKYMEDVNKFKELYPQLSKGQKFRYFGSQAELPSAIGGSAVNMALGGANTSKSGVSGYKLPTQVQQNLQKKLSLPSNWASMAPKFNKFYSGAKSLN